MACLGELLFYIAAMPAEATAVSCWDVKSTTLSSIVSLLRAKEDSTVQVQRLASHLHIFKGSNSVAR